MRKPLLLLAIALVAAACGGTGESTVDQAPATTVASSEVSATPETTVAAEEPAGAAGSEAPATTEASAPSHDGPAAPDFELDLNDGTTFTLAGEEKPVFMVFWAEW